MSFPRTLPLFRMWVVTEVGVAGMRQWPQANDPPSQTYLWTPVPVQPWLVPVSKEVPGVPGWGFPSAPPSALLLAEVMGWEPAVSPAMTWCLAPTGPWHAPAENREWCCRSHSTCFQPLLELALIVISKSNKRWRGTRWELLNYFQLILIVDILSSNLVSWALPFPFSG